MCNFKINLLSAHIVSDIVLNFGDINQSCKKHVSKSGLLIRISFFIITIWNVKKVRLLIVYKGNQEYSGKNKYHEPII